MPIRPHLAFAGCLALFFGAAAGVAAEPLALLDLPGAGTDPAKIDYEALPRLVGALAVVRPAAIDPQFADVKSPDMHHLKFGLHEYLVHHDGRFWCLWSEGPPVEDEPTQEVRFATSRDGLSWSESRSVTGTPKAPYAFIARGFWVRDGKLLALAAHFKGKGAFGVDKELELRAYAWDAAADRWKLEGVLYDDAINNFPPQRLPSGEWILTRRDARFNVSVLIGGSQALDDWRDFPVVGRGDVPGFSPDEPILWALPDESLFALYRDNGGSQRLFHSTSSDAGRTWTRPVLTNVPNSSSKLFSMRTSRGDRILVSNANPVLNRRELHLSVSRDGRTFVRMARLDIPTPEMPKSLGTLARKFESGIASLQYPHVIEHDEHLWITFSRGKKQVEVLKVPRASVDRLLDE